jgi:tRNA G37 N-methylase Trm5
MKKKVQPYTGIYNFSIDYVKIRAPQLTVKYNLNCDACELPIESGPIHHH